MQWFYWCNLKHVKMAPLQIIPAGCVLGKGQTEVTQVVLLVFHLLHSVWADDPDQTWSRAGFKIHPQTPHAQQTLNKIQVIVISLITDYSTAKHRAPFPCFKINFHLLLTGSSLHILTHTIYHFTWWTTAIFIQRHRPLIQILICGAKQHCLMEKMSMQVKNSDT